MNEYKMNEKIMMAEKQQANQASNLHEITCATAKDATAFALLVENRIQ